MREGVLIDYRLRVRGVPLRWRTRINVWQPPHRFVDEQIHGPYRQWIHEHTFEVRDGGTLARDVVHYAVPLDFLVHRWLVLPDIEKSLRSARRNCANDFQHGKINATARAGGNLFVRLLCSPASRGWVKLTRWSA